MPQQGHGGKSVRSCRIQIACHTHTHGVDDQAAEFIRRFADEHAPRALRELDLARLVGLPIEEARDLVEKAGGEFRPFRDDQPLRGDLRADRVTAEVDESRVIGLPHIC